MSDTTSPTTNQCPTCDEKDTVVIAGKTFCATCGTPYVPSGTVAPQPAAQTSVPRNSTPASQSVVSPSPTSPSLSVSGLASQTSTSAEAKPVQDKPAGDSIVKDSPAASQITLRPQANQLHDALATPVSSSISKYSSDAPVADKMPNTTSVSAAATQQDTKPASSGTSSQVPQPVAGSTADIDIANEKKNSEISSLSDKSDETVMSDEALDALAGVSPPLSTVAKDDKSTEQAIAKPTPEAAQIPGSATSNSVPPAESKPEAKQPVAPVESSYKLDLTKAQSSTLPKAVSDVRPAARQNPVAPTNTAPATTPQQTQPSPAAQTTSAPVPSAIPSSQTPIPAPVPPVASPSSSNPIGMGAVSPSAASTASPNSSAVGVQPPAAPAVTPTQPAPAPVQQTAPPVGVVSAPISTAPAVSVAPTAVQQNSSMPQTMAAQQPAAIPDAIMQSMVTAAPGGSALPTPSPAATKSGFKVSSVALSMVGLLLVGAYIWQVNYPNLALKVAGSKAGISANFPGYVPNGWKLNGNIQSSPGVLSYNITNQKGDKNLAVSEAKTDWDSQALAENYVSQKSSNYLALQAQGLTIYLYGDNQASWVNNGNWYKLEGSKTGISQDQLIKIATSL